MGRYFIRFKNVFPMIACCLLFSGSLYLFLWTFDVLASELFVKLELNRCSFSFIVNHANLIVYSLSELLDESSSSSLSFCSNALDTHIYSCFFFFNWDILPLSGVSFNWTFFVGWTTLLLTKTTYQCGPTFLS